MCDDSEREQRQPLFKRERLYSATETRITPAHFSRCTATSLRQGCHQPSHYQRPRQRGQSYPFSAGESRDSWPEIPAKPGYADNSKEDEDRNDIPVSAKANSSKEKEDEKKNVKDQRRQLALITLVTFFISCSGNLHSPVMTQYAYQVYTDKVYGNASAGVQISKQPCVNQSQNSSQDSRSKQVQDESADLFMHLDMVSGGIATVVNLFLGSYSDVLGRRFLMLVPMVGHFLRNASAPVIIYLNLGLPALYAGYLVDGLCGGASSIFLGLYVYTADTTTSERQRTMGMAIIETATGLTTAATNLGAGYFIQDTGFFYPSLVASLLLLCSIFIVVLWLPETVTLNRKQCLSPLQGAQRVFGVFLFPGQVHQRALLLLALLAFFLTQLPAMADYKVRTLYLMDRPFCWSSVQIGFLLAAKDSLSRTASLLFILVLQGCLVTPLLALIGVLSLLAGYVLMGLAWDSVTVYMVPVVSMAGSMLLPSLRSMMSRLASPDKRGALFASIAVVESVCYCFGQFVFLSLYKDTISSLRGLIFFVIGGFHLLIAVILLIYVYLLRQVIPSQIRPISIQADDIIGVDSANQHSSN